MSSSQSFPASWDASTIQSFQNLRNLLIKVSTSSDPPPPNPTTLHPRSEWPAGIHLEEVEDLKAKVGSKARLVDFLERAEEPTEEKGGKDELKGYWFFAEKEGRQIARDAKKDHVVLYAFGGGNISGHPLAQPHVTVISDLTRRSQVPVFSPAYRLAKKDEPKRPFRQLHDFVVAYFYLTEVLGYAPERVHIRGESAGAGHAFALTYYLIEHNLPTPGSLVVTAPLVDSRLEAPNFHDNEVDMVPGSIYRLGRATWLGPLEASNQNTTHRYIDQIQLNDEKVLSKFPKALFIVGGLDQGLEGVKLVYQGVTKAQEKEGVDEAKRAQLWVEPDMPHCWFMFPTIFVTQANSGLQRLTDFVKSASGSSSP